MRSLGRALVAAAGLMSLLAPTAAVASWWDGGYDGRYDSRRGNNPTTTTTNRAGSGYEQPGESDTTPDDGQPPESNERPNYAPPPESNERPDYGRPEYSAPPECERPCGSSPPECERPCGPPPPAPPPPPPPPGPFAPIYGCENSDLHGTDRLLHKTTTPPPGTPVRPGDEILVEITWRPFDWMGYDLHKAIDCVYINGVFVPGLSGGERPTPNDGHFAWHYFVPVDVPPGSTICDQGFVSGPNGYDDYGRAVSNIVCFPVSVPPPPPPPPCCAAPPPPPPVEAPTTTTTTTVPEDEQPQPYAGPERVSQQVPPGAEAAGPPAPTLLARDRVLPRTGGDSDPARLALGALGLAMLAARAGRIRRR
jgi:hypothetical protein